MGICNGFIKDAFQVNDCRIVNDVISLQKHGLIIKNNIFIVIFHYL